MVGGWLRSVPVAPRLSAQAAARDALFHMDDGHHLKLIGADTVNDPVEAFMHLTPKEGAMRAAFPSALSHTRAFESGNSHTGQTRSALPSIRPHVVRVSESL